MRQTVWKTVVGVLGLVAVTSYFALSRHAKSIQPVESSSPTHLEGQEFSTTELKTMEAPTSSVMEHVQQVTVEQSQARPICYSTMYPDLDVELGLNKRDANKLCNSILRGATERDIESLLGTNAYQGWLDFKTSIDDRKKAEEVKHLLSFGDHPLSEDGFRNLTRTMVAERMRRAAEMRAKPATTDQRVLLEYDAHNVKVVKESYGRIVNEAVRYYLDPEQTAVLRRYLDSKLRSAEASVVMRRSYLDKGKELPEDMRSK